MDKSSDVSLKMLSEYAARYMVSTTVSLAIRGRPAEKICVEALVAAARELATRYGLSINPDFTVMEVEGAPRTPLIPCRDCSGVAVCKMAGVCRLTVK